MYGLVIVHEDGCALSTVVTESEACHRFEEATKEKSVVYAHCADTNYYRVNYYVRPER